MNTPSPDKPLPNQLKMPEGVSSMGMVADMTEAYIKAVIAIPEVLEGILNELSLLNDGLSVLTLYAEKRGLSEGLFSPDDLDKGEDDEIGNVKPD